MGNRLEHCSQLCRFSCREAAGLEDECPPNTKPIIRRTYNKAMARVRVVSFLLLLAAAIFAPLVASGYAELQAGTRAKDYVDAAQHYRAAAQRLPWRTDLY